MDSNNIFFNCFYIFLFFLLPFSAVATADSEVTIKLDLTSHSVGYIAIILFVFAYIVVVCEECTQLRKPNPVILAAGIIWSLITYQYSTAGLNDLAVTAFRRNVLKFTELFLFLLVTMTYVNTMYERHIFMALRSLLVLKHLSYRLDLPQEWHLWGKHWACIPFILICGGHR